MKAKKRDDRAALTELIQLLLSAQSARRHGRRSTFEKKLKRAQKLVEELNWRVFNVDMFLQ